MDSHNSAEAVKNPCSLYLLHRRRLHDDHQHHRPHHHHHFFYVSPHCPIHRSIMQPENHSPACSFSTSNPSPQQPLQVASIPADPYSSFSDQTNQIVDDASMMQEETAKAEQEEEDEEPIFVLTDEWREFFAKSEAKRRLAKQQAKKKGKI